MKFGVMGTGVVGQTIAGRLAETSNDVMVGTRDVAKKQLENKPDNFGNPPFSAWNQQHPQVKLGTYGQAAAHGEILFNATSGGVSLEALKMIALEDLNGKILVDVANPLDFSRGFPPSLSVVNTDSLGEQIQRTFPQVKVVKTLNTVNCQVMVNPGRVAGGDHHVFVSGNDQEAKATVTGLLKEIFGWKNVIDLGDITTARGTEMLMTVWLELMSALKTPNFNFKIVQ